ncbi:NADPH:quinone oxidoreductase family protein [Paracoccus caeni]|uniref:NADPH:quinone oxidoreductase family protein n=1 Tax=Paracoccus caeni TaxID=657651 RepID=A0A934S9Z2_9RHOB|nr:NADPH:quinone oxidoreductase family protein [Paracoccus caeni]
MSAAFIDETGGNPVIREVAAPIPQPGEVILRMHAAALNFADLLKARGQYQERADWPFVIGLEGAGEVVTAPENSDLHPGDRVAVLAQGSMSQMLAVPADACVKIPDSMSYQEAAGFQIAYGTSHLALTLRAGLRAGETLLVLGAAGGVGLTAVEIGHAMGARVIGVARGQDRLEVVRKAGADLLIDSATCDNLTAALREAGGVDVVYDAVGDAPGEAAFRALKPGGRYLVIGFAGGKPPALPLNHALVKNIAIHGLYWGGYGQLDPKARLDSLNQLFAMFQARQLQPVTGEVLPLAEIAKGFAMLRERSSVGKIVISL